MADWPASLPPISLKYWEKQPHKFQLRAKPEDGPIISRARQTKMRWEFTVGWVFISQTDYATLVTFFDDYLGDTFNFTDPLNSTVYVVGFQQDKLPKASISSALDPSDGSWGYTISGIILEER